MPCGSTVGPHLSAELGIPTVDLGEAILSMHSIREMSALVDHTGMQNLMNAFYKA
jgi:aspartyl aminopeptidase